MTRHELRSRFIAFGVPLACAACGGGSDGSGGTGGGAVTDAWLRYCTATFTRDYQVIDEFDDPLFRARAGEEYLMMDWGPGFGEARAMLAYLSPKGPYDFSITSPEDALDFPFTSNCTYNSGTAYYAVFTDVSVYATEDLSTKLCDLPAGTVVVRDTAQPTYFAATGFNLSGPTVYEVSLNTLAAQCGGAETGSVNVPETRLFGFTTWLVPIRPILGP